MEERYRAEVSPVTVSQTKTGRYVFKGVASTTGNVDRMRRVFLPGAFGSARIKVPLLANHDENQILGSSTLIPNNGRLLHESSINPKARMADEMISLLEEGDIASTSISWLSNQRFYGWSDLKRNNPEMARQAASLGIPQQEDVVYFGTAEIVENSVVPIPANDRALIGAASLVGDLDRGFIESMREVASMSTREIAAGARNSSQDRATIQRLHDDSVILGALCTETPTGTTDVEDGDDSEDRQRVNEPMPPLGGWTRAMNPQGSLDDRETAATAKYAMPDGSYPISTCADVTNAANLAHHSKTYSFAEVKAHVMKAMEGLSCPASALPDTWKDDSSLPLPSEFEEVDRELAVLASRFNG